MSRSLTTGVREALAGVLAAAAMLAGMLMLRLATEVPSLPELIGEGVIRTLPPELFSRLLDLLLRAAKPTLQVSIVLGTLALGGWFGRLYAREPGLPRALAIISIAWLVVGIVLLPLLGLGPFAAGMRPGAVVYAASIYAGFLVFALSLSLFHHLLVAPPAKQTPADHRQARRTALARLGVGAAALAIGGYGWRALVGTPSSPRGAAEPPPGSTTTTATATTSTASVAGAFSPQPGERPDSGHFALAGLSPEVTPTRDFYNVSKNFFDPTVDVSSWSLRIDGMVERPFTLDFAQIQKLPSVSKFHTLMCISNPVGGDLWGNAHWRGVRLKELLDQAGVKPGVRKVVFHGADDYTDSIVLERALNPETIVAYEMNGAPLEKTHGFPARLLIPNIYGMKNVKWVTRIELVDHDFKGYWMQRGWSDPAPYQIASRFDVPNERANSAPGEVPIGGVAYAGDRGVASVEYSLDDGKSWQPAELKPALAPNTWQLWTARLSLPVGRYTVKVRATDGRGEVQAGKEFEPLPDGVNGFHSAVLVIA